MSNKDIIKKAFGHKLIGTSYLKNMVVQTVGMLPDELINFATKYLWFVGSFPDGYAFTLKDSDIGQGEYIIFLSDELMDEPSWQIRFSIMHEIGHAVLGHKNSIGISQTKAEIKRQEREADEFAKKYLI